MNETLRQKAESRYFHPILGGMDPGFCRDDDPHDLFWGHQTSRPFGKYLQSKKVLDGLEGWL
jgi:hypothetical protein